MPPRQIGPGARSVIQPKSDIVPPSSASQPTPPPKSPIEAMRSERDSRLEEAAAMLDRHRNQRDYGLPTSITDEKAAEWATYAQALRDLPEQFPDGINVVWPASP